MTTSEHVPGCQRGVGLIEVMISIIIGMLMVLVIFQIYEVSEGQKRTITAGSDAQQNASYGLFALGRELSMGGSGIASSATALDGCAILRPIPAVIKKGATDNDPDEITVLYGGSSSLSTPVPFRNTPTTAQPYTVPGPVGFSPFDVVVAIQGTTCTVSTINAGGVAINPANGEATLTHTPVAGTIPAAYGAGASLVNLGSCPPALCPLNPRQDGSMSQVVYSVDASTHALRTRNQLPAFELPAVGPNNPLISEVVNLKAQYGLDTTVPPDGIIDVWQDATGAWDFAAVTAAPGPPLATLRQILALRIAIVTRSAQYEKDAVTPGPLTMFDGGVSMTLTTDEQHYRYKVLETVVPLRNALWNAP